jgi:alpha-galactosidase
MKLSGAFIVLFLVLVPSDRGWATDNCANLPALAVLPDNGLVRTPPMGINSWYSVGAAVTETYIKAQANALVSTGLLSVGYNYVDVDDGWMAATRDGSGNIQPDPTKFPDGMLYLSSYVHGLGEKLGLYSSPYTTTCAGYIGSGTNEARDAATMASWNIDFLKYDGCNVLTLYPSCSSSASTEPEIWQLMAQSLRATGRPVALQTGTVPSGTAWLWARQAGYNDYRAVMVDTSGNWAFWDSQINTFAELSSYGAVGFWADSDYLVNSSIWSSAQKSTQFGMDALWSAPLVLGYDLTTTSSSDITNIYSNTEVVAVDQDAAGRIAKRVISVACGSATCETWIKSLSTGQYAIGLLNRDAAAHTMSVDLSRYNYPAVRDLWAHASLGALTSYSTSVGGYGLAMLLVTPNGLDSGTSMQNVSAQHLTVQ